MEIFNKLEASIDFSSKFLINSLASGGGTLRIPTNAYVRILLNLCPNFSEKFDKI